MLFRSAVAYARALHALVRWIGICDGNMQEGSFRCDANVSVRPAGSDKLGTRREIKNLNSFRFLQQAIEYEARRQVEIIEDPASRVFISAVTGYEIANKFRTGKMPEAGPVLELMKSEFAAYDWLHLPVTLQHAQHAGGLSGEHRDPFDRLLAAQAELEGLTLVSLDPALRAFPCRLLW